MSGATTSRDGLDAALAVLRVGDTLIVARLDRLGRSMPYLVATVHELAEKRIGFGWLAESIDTTSAAGKLVLHMFAALAAFEPDLIRERTRDALAATKRRSRLEAARKMVADGERPAHVAWVLKVGRSTLYPALREVA